MFQRNPTDRTVLVRQPQVPATRDGGRQSRRGGESFVFAGSSDKAHAKLVIERGKSVGKQFMLSSAESRSDAGMLTAEFSPT